MIGGSLASSVVGEPRSTLDINMAVHLDDQALDSLADALRPALSVPTDAAREAVRSRSSCNLLHDASVMKVGIVVLGEGLLDRRQLERRIAIGVGGESPTELWGIWPEDQVRRKLDWFSRGGEMSDRQWRDLLGILDAQKGRLDDGCLEVTARAIGLSTPLQRARTDRARRRED